MGVHLAGASTLIMMHIARINPAQPGIPLSQQSLHAKVGILLNTPTAILHPNSAPSLLERVLPAILYFTFGGLLGFYLGRRIFRRIALNPSRSPTALKYGALTIHTETYLATVALPLVFLFFSVVLGFVPSPSTYQAAQFPPLKLTIFYAAMPTAMRHSSVQFQPVDILLGLALHATLIPLLSFCVGHLLSRRRLRRLRSHPPQPPASPPHQPH